jgi:DNA-binding CsgD family transcriptional regulator
MRGFLAVLQADPITAAPVLERAATAARDHGRFRLLTEALSMGSVAANLAGDRASGRRLLHQALDVVRHLDDLPARLAVLQAQALDGFSDGDLVTFRAASTEGARLSRDAGDRYTLQIWLMNQGFAALTADDGDDPGPLLGEALRVAHQIDDRLVQSYLIAGLGCHAAMTGESRRAAFLFGAADRLRTETGSGVNAILAPLRAIAEKTARDALGTSVFDAEYDAGGRSDRDAAVRQALREPARRPVAAPSGGGPSPLAKRETQVARLVADGLTNKQIGARLFISERTVENHVRNIMNKLGFTARTQIAAWSGGVAAIDSSGERPR